MTPGFSGRTQALLALQSISFNRSDLVLAYGGGRLIEWCLSQTTLKTSEYNYVFGILFNCSVDYPACTMYFTMPQLSDLLFQRMFQILPVEQKQFSQHQSLIMSILKVLFQHLSYGKEEGEYIAKHDFRTFQTRLNRNRGFPCIIPDGIIPQTGDEYAYLRETPIIHPTASPLTTLDTVVASLPPITLDPSSVPIFFPILSPNPLDSEPEHIRNALRSFQYNRVVTRATLFEPERSLGRLRRKLTGLIWADAQALLRDILTYFNPPPIL